ncbi:phage tail protein [Vibrio fluvialis]|nr:phage tail protein [Vibrio fluvialis]MBY7899929.1 phage tail protein [Vibrio fluvialis]MBY7938590.1 phage tail protein [Vibrio fluvialis]MBY8230253.1 phage tail protein [Vibrio fluvialis]
MSERNGEFVSVQPENRTLIEEALEYAWGRLLNKQSPPYPDLKSPLRTPEEFVVLLAAERGVADWQPGDTLQQQRVTTDRAFEIHSEAGTRGGLQVALAALGFDAEVKRGNLPYSLQITSWSGAGVSNRTLERVQSRTVQYKSERDSFSLAVGFKASGSVYVGGAVVSAPRVLVGPWVPPIIEASGAQYVGGAVQSVMRVIVNEYRPD